MITKQRISEIIVEELHKILKSEDRNNLKESSHVEINEEYTHFLVDKETNMIVHGIEGGGLDKDSIKEFLKTDLKDLNLKPNDVKLYTKSQLLSKGIDPFDEENWEMELFM